MNYNTDSTSTLNRIQYAKAILQGFGQIMLRNNVWTGLFLLAVITL